MQFNWSSWMRGDWKSFLPWRRCGGGRGSWGANFRWNEIVDFPEVSLVDLVFGGVFFFFWIVRGRGYIAHWSHLSGFFNHRFPPINPPKLRSPIWILSTWNHGFHAMPGEFLLHLGEGNRRGGLSSLGYVAGHESEDYNWWPRSLQRWRLFWRVLFRGFQLRRRLSMLHIGLHFQVRKDL